MNDQNLIPISQRTSSELREMTKKGGVASGEARRRKRQLGEIANIVGVLKADKKKQKALNEFGVDKAEDMIHDVVLIVEQYKKAEEGDTRAAEFIAKIRGELVNKQGITTNGEAIEEVALIFGKPLPKYDKNKGDSSSR